MILRIIVNYEKWETLAVSQYTIVYFVSKSKNILNNI